jgi:iron complex outermembrane receptor protein
MIFHKLKLGSTFIMAIVQGTDRRNPAGTSFGGESMSIRNVTAIRAILLAGPATIAAMPGTAFAFQDTQTAAADAATQPAAADDEVVETGDIVVTARRRNEALLDVPIAVTAYSGAELERQGAVDITDIGDTTPNVTLEVSRGTNSTLTAFIRGIGQQDPVGGFEQGVGLYLDDVYINRPQGAVLDIYDVERIEVLRGPQGTLYGRNTIGGAIKYVTRRLSDVPELKLRGTVGTYGQLDAVATVSFPIADMFRVGGSVARLTRDGFGRNFTTGKENYNKDVKAARVSAEIGRDESALLRLSADYTKDDSNTRGGHRLIPNQCTAAACTIAPNLIGDEFNSYGALLDPTQKVVSKGIAAHGQLEVADGITLKSITAFRRDKSATPIDFDALPAVDLDVPAFYKNKQFSQEFQAEYNRGPLSGVVGAYYLDANAKTTFDVRITTQLPGFTAFSDGDVDTKTWAVFGDFTYDITDQFSAAVGARYTSDKRHATVLRQTLFGGGSPIFGGAGNVFATTSNFEGRRHDKAFTPRVSLSYKPNDNHHIYVSWAKGFKGGGFDPRGQSTRAPDTDGTPGLSDAEIYDYMAFDPEKVTSYELGWKGSLFDKRVFAGVAIFRANYKDMQIPASVGCQIGGQPNFCGETSNAGKARIQGIEFEGDARLFGQPGGSRLNFGWSLGYLDAKFKEFITTVLFEPDGTPIPIPGEVVDLADFLKIQNTPKWTASGTLSYTSYIADGRLDLSSTLSYRSKSQQFEQRSPGLDQKGFALLDASAVYELPGGHWTVGLHGKNLTDTRYITAGYNFLAANPYTGEYFRTPSGGYIPQAGLGRTGILTAYYGNPRQIMFTVGYKL